MRKTPKFQAPRVKQYIPRGAARDLFVDRSLDEQEPVTQVLKDQKAAFISASEILIEGPAGTGKTYAVQMLVKMLVDMYPKMRVLFTRLTRAAMTETVLVTWEEQVLGESHYSLKKGGQRETRQKYVFANGSEVVCIGMNNWNRIMSAEYDLVVYFEVVDEPDEAKWAAMQTRLRNQRVPFPRTIDGKEPYANSRGVLLPKAYALPIGIPRKYRTVWDLKNAGWFAPEGKMAGAEWPDGTPVFWHLGIADCNPGHPQHWANLRPEVKDDDGNPTMLRLLSRHEDNPTVTKKYLKRLDSLPPELKARLRDGIWTAAEGAIYKEFNERTHVVSADPDRKFDYTVASVDWGFEEAGVVQVWGVNSVGMFRIAEVYFRGKTGPWWYSLVQDLYAKFQFAVCVCDPSQPQRIKELQQHLGKFDIDCRVKGAENAILEGLDAVRAALRPPMGEAPHLYLVRDAFPKGLDHQLKALKRPQCLEQEIGQYAWALWVPGKPFKEGPRAGQHDHACDAMRYAVMEVMFQGGIPEGDGKAQIEQRWVLEYLKDRDREERRAARKNGRRGRLRHRLEQRRMNGTPY